jgi:ABC-type multidrug transport system permease subunit
MDPFQGLANLALGWLKRTAIAEWSKFLFEILFSAVVSFLIICGTMLVSSRNWPVSVGSGMFVAGVAMTVLFRKESSRLTRGMLVVLPQLEANKEIETDLQTIQKKEK